MSDFFLEILGTLKAFMSKTGLYMVNIQFNKKFKLFVSLEVRI